MFQLLAHHDGGLLRSLDFLGLQPETASDHVVAFSAYGLLLAALIGAGLGSRLALRRALGILQRADPRAS
jgi:hypothetical protein